MAGESAGALAILRFGTMDLPSLGMSQIASATKHIAGVALMRLAEAGKLALSDRVRKHLPTLRKSWTRITHGDLPHTYRVFRRPDLMRRRRVLKSW